MQLWITFQEYKLQRWYTVFSPFVWLLVISKLNNRNTKRNNTICGKEEYIGNILSKVKKKKEKKREKSYSILILITLSFT